MTDVTLNNITSGYNIAKMNDNFQKLQNSINTDLLNLAGGNNTLLQDIDLNGHSLLNAGTVSTNVLMVDGKPIFPLTEVGYLGNGVVFENNLDTAFSDTLVRVANETYASLAEFGAVGDGSDESSKIQAALDSGRNIFVPNGVYVATGLQLNTNNARLVGPGTIKKKAGVDQRLLTVNGTGCVIDGVVFDGTATQPNFWYMNDIMDIFGSNTKVVHCVIYGSYGGGIIIQAGVSNCVIAFNQVYNTHDNNIMVAGANSNGNIILGNHCDGTTSQNNIFVTASPDSSPTANHNYHNRVQGNTCVNSGDTGIEAGIGTVGCLIQGNTVLNSVNPEILTRDSLDCIIENNYAAAGSKASAAHDTIAVLEQTQTGGIYKCTVRGNRCTGKITRSGVYIQAGGGVVVQGNYIDETFASVDSTTGAGLIGSGISVAAGVTEVDIIGNNINRVGIGINMNVSTAPTSSSRVHIEGNSVYQAITGVSLYNVSFSDTTIKDNNVSKVVTAGFITQNSSGNNSSIICGNRLNIGGFTSATPTNFTYGALDGIGWFTSQNTKRVVIPETQYSQVVLVEALNKSSGVLTIDFEDGTESGVFGISEPLTAKVVGTANLLDSSGSGAFASWSLFVDGSSNLILQRRGSDTGSSARYLRYRFTKTMNEL